MKINKYFNTASENNVIIWMMSNLAYPISKFFVLTKITPNFLTFLSIIFTLISFYFIITNNYFLFIIFWFLNIVFDFCDGQVARLTNKVNQNYFRFDYYSDLLKISIIFLGIGIFYNLINLWIIIFITNFLYLFYCIIHSNYSSISENLNKQSNSKYNFFNHFKNENFFVAVIKSLIPVISRFNGHSLILFFFLPFNVEICLFILLYINIIFSFQISKVIKKLLKFKKL